MSSIVLKRPGGSSTGIQVVTRPALWFAVLSLVLACSAGSRSISADGEVRGDGRRGDALVIEGFGAGTLGGSGGQVLTVTNLNDSGRGSLREAINTPGPRVIRFGVSGTIDLKSNISVGHPFVTIDGSDAPDGGVAIRGASLIIDAPQVIVRHIRVRPGPGVPDPGNGDAITIKGSADHVVLDHCSLSWSTDETLTIYGRDVTVQWSFITEGLNCVGHPGGCHSKGLFLPEPSTRVSVLHTLVAHQADRNPFVRPGLTNVPNQYQFVNNVFYNYAIPTFIETLAPTGTMEFDFIGNFYKRGVNNTSLSAILLAGRRLAAFKGSLSLYLHGNISPQRLRDSAAQDLLLPEERRGYVSGQRHFRAVASESDAFTAVDRVLTSAGATLPCRDAVDRRVASDVRGGSGRIIDDPVQVGGWPALTCSG